MVKVKIEEFVEQNFGIKLNAKQLEMIALIAANPEKHFVIDGGKLTGKTTAYKAAMAYLQDGFKPLVILDKDHNTELLKDEELKKELLVFFYEENYQGSANDAVEFIKSQKIAHADIVVGKDDSDMNKDFHGRGYDVKVRNILRAEQRQRNK